MFIRYTHYGIGHPTVLRGIARDCTGADLADNPELDEIDDIESGVRPCKGDDGGGEEEDDDEDEDDDDDDNECVDDLDDREMEENDEEDDHISF